MLRKPDKEPEKESMPVVASPTNSMTPSNLKEDDYTFTDDQRKAYLELQSYYRDPSENDFHDDGFGDELSTSDYSLYIIDKLKEVNARLSFDPVPVESDRVPKITFKDPLVDLVVPLSPLSTCSDSSSSPFDWSLYSDDVNDEDDEDIITDYETPTVYSKNEEQTNGKAADETGSSSANEHACSSKDENSSKLLTTHGDHVKSSHEASTDICTNPGTAEYNRAKDNQATYNTDKHTDTNGSKTSSSKGVVDGKYSNQVSAKSTIYLDEVNAHDESEERVVTSSNADAFLQKVPLNSAPLHANEISDVNATELNSTKLVDLESESSSSTSGVITTVTTDDKINNDIQSTSSNEDVHESLDDHFLVDIYADSTSREQDSARDFNGTVTGQQADVSLSKTNTDDIREIVNQDSDNLESFQTDVLHPTKSLNDHSNSEISNTCENRAEVITNDQINANKPLGNDVTRLIESEKTPGLVHGDTEPSTGETENSNNGTGVSAVCREDQKVPINEAGRSGAKCQTKCPVESATASGARPRSSYSLRKSKVNRVALQTSRISKSRMNSSGSSPSVSKHVQMSKSSSPSQKSQETTRRGHKITASTPVSNMRTAVQLPSELRQNESQGVKLKLPRSSSVQSRKPLMLMSPYVISADHANERRKKTLTKTTNKEKQREEEERKRRKQEAEMAYKAWLSLKRQQNGKNKQRGNKAEAGNSKDKAETTTSREEELRLWLKKKEEQKHRERLTRQFQEQELSSASSKKVDPEKAFRRWLRKKKAQEAMETNRTLLLQSSVMSATTSSATRTTRRRRTVTPPVGGSSSALSKINSHTLSVQQTEGLIRTLQAYVDSCISNKNRPTASISGVNK